MCGRSLRICDESPASADGRRRSTPFAYRPWFPNIVLFLRRHDMERIAISKFKATCMAVLEKSLQNRENGSCNTFRRAGGVGRPCSCVQGAEALGRFSGGNRANQRRHRFSRRRRRLGSPARMKLPPKIQRSRSAMRESSYGTEGRCGAGISCTNSRVPYIDVVAFPSPPRNIQQRFPKAARVGSCCEAGGARQPPLR
jgi:hypothetical protein